MAVDFCCSKKKLSFVRITAVSMASVTSATVTAFRLGDDNKNA